MKRISTIRKDKYFLTLLCVLVAILLPNEVWSISKATVTLYSEPSVGGVVHVDKTDGVAPSATETNSPLTQEAGFWDTGVMFNFYLSNNPTAGYVFKGYAESQNVNIGTVNSPYSLKGTTTGASKTLYAIFATLQASATSLSETQVGQSSECKVTIKHAHAGIVSLSLDNTAEFSLSKTSFSSTAAGIEEVIVRFTPKCASAGLETRTATLTITSNNGLSNVNISLSGKASLIQGQSLSWVEPINTNILKGTTAKIKATATSGLVVSYSSNKPGVLTVDANGNITAIGEGDAIITASQAGDCTYAAATSITKTFTISDKKTPTFWLENNPDLTEKNLMVDGTTTISITNIDAAGFKADYDANLLGFSLVDGVATITAKNAGTATLTLTQTETNAVFATSRVFTFHISRYTGTLALTNNLGTAYKVDDAVNIVDCYTASNSEVEVQVASSNTDVIAVVDGKLKAVGAGTATVTFSQAETYKWTALSVSQTITVTKYDLSASISQATATWDETINNPFAITYNLNDFFVQSLDPSIATYANGAIQTYAETGTARFLISRPEDYKYNQLAETLSINVAAEQKSCYVLEQFDEVNINYYDGAKQYNLSGIGERLSVLVHKQNYGTQDFTIQGYDANGNATTLINLGNDDIPTSYGSPFTCSVPENIVRIEVTSGGTLDKYFRELRITRKNFLTPNTDAIIMSSSKGQNATATFDVAYGSCGCTVKVVSNNPKITVSPTSFYAEGNGTQTITITGDASEEGTETATITLYDQSKKTTVTFTNTTVGKLTTHIEYTGQASYDQSAGEQSNPFRVIDANGVEVIGAKITMVSDKIAVLSVSEDGVSSFTPSCGGNVTLTATYDGDEAHQPSTLSQSIFVEKCAHHIEWQQSLMGFTATPEGVINETVLLTARAVNDNGTATNIPITYTIADPTIATLIDNGNGTYSVHVTAVGETTITATTAEDDTYAIESVTHSIRVRKEGEACHSFAIEHANQLSMFMGGTTDELVISGLPDQLTFDAKRGGGAIGNGITIQYNDGSSWQDLQTIDLTGSWASYGPYPVPEAAQRLRFIGSGTLSRYVRNIYVTQKTYLHTDIASISISDKVHKSFSQSFSVAYSDIPVIQYSIECTNPNITLALTTDRPVSNNCGEYGTYTFTLSGSSNFPGDYSGTIHLHTSAGDARDIPFTIKITLNGTFYFNKEAGDWDTTNKWKYGYSYDHGLLPDGATEAVISKPVTLNSHAEVYALRIEEEGMITIGENGGLTVYEGGITIKNASSIHLISNHNGAGYLRVSPNSTMSSAPEVTTHYTTRSTLSTGANKDATWQYVGAPGDNCNITTDGSQWLYLWDEQNGWVQKSGTLTLTPFAGYAITQYGQPTYEWTSTMILANHDVVLTKTADGMDGANVFVNSYTAPIDVKCFTPEDFKGDMDKTFYLFNAGSWNQWNAGESNGSNLGKNGDDTPGHYCAIPALAASYMDPAYDITTIPPMQGVYVKTNADEARIHLNYEKHVWKATDSNLNRPMRKATLNEDTAQPSFARVRIQANSTNSGADRLYVIQDSLFSKAYDNGYDAPKEIADGLMNLYVSEPFELLEVACSDHIDSTTIGFTAGEDSNYTLRFTSIVDEETLYLSDNENGLCVQIEEGMEYTFTALPYSNNVQRFVLLRTPTANTPQGPTTDYENQSEHSFKPEGRLVMKDGQVYIVAGGLWYTMLGQSVQQK